jgi:ATP-dependent exoDNAse (exonuclease V) beta subunit
MPEDAEAVRILTIHKSKGLQFPVVILSAFESKNSKTESKWLDNEGNLPETLSTFKFQLSKKMLETEIKDHVLEAQQKGVLDRLNLLYVGTTRPEKALFIITSYNDKFNKEVEESNWESMLNMFVRNGKWKPTENYTLLELGSKEDILPGKIQNPTDTFSISEYSTAKWRNKIKIARNKTIAQSLNQEQEALAKGNLFHQFLSGINAKDDVQIQLNSYKSEGLLSQTDIDHLENILGQLFSNQEISNLFSNAIDIINEHDLMIDGMKFIRPDKVFKLDNEIVVVDFKTGIKRDSDYKQVSLYIKSLSELYNKSCRGIIVYLSDDIQLLNVE